MVRRGAVVLACVLALGLVVEAQLRTRVRIFGAGEAPGGGDGETFTLVLIPDTQNYVANDEPDFTTQTQFISDHETSLNIAFVSHMGDVVNSLSSTTEYTRADTSWDIIDAADIPNGVVAGNHDNPVSSDSIFHNYFGNGRHGGEAWWCGYINYNAGVRGPMASCQLFTAGGQNFVHISVAYLSGLDEFVGETTIEDEVGEVGWNTVNKPFFRWIRDKLIEYDDRQAIMSFHQFQLGTGARAEGYDEVFDLVIAPATNVFLVMNGHEISGSPGCTTGKCESQRTDNTGGRDVHQLLFNAQNRSNGDGWMQLLTFDPDTRQIQVKTYSPVLSFVSCTVRGVALLLGQCETDANSQFTLTWPVFP